MYDSIVTLQLKGYLAYRDQICTEYYKTVLMWSLRF